MKDMLVLNNIKKIFFKGTVNEKVALENLNLNVPPATLSPFWAPTAQESPPCSTLFWEHIRWRRETFF